MSRKYGDRDGSIPLHTLRADIDYGFTEARTPSGNIGIKVWVYRGDVLPEARPSEARPERPATAPSERPRRGWRRVGPRREEGEAEAAGAGDASAEQAAAPEQVQAEEQQSDVDAVQGQVSETAEGPSEG